MWLQTEYNHAKTYLQIQQMRFWNRLSVDLEDFPKNAEKITVPRLILQPILENAFNHGVRNLPENGLIRLRFNQKENNLHIIIDDNGNIDDKIIHKLSEKLQNNESIRETTGPINIHKRLQLTFGMEYGITLGKSDLGGLMVDIKIPIEKI